MNTLTLQYTPPPKESLKCIHCDESIMLGEDYKYVKFIYGKTRFNFHELCFVSVLSALNKFDFVFLKEESGEKGQKVH